jgi:hypothetical protein
MFISISFNFITSPTYIYINIIYFT